MYQSKLSSRKAIFMNFIHFIQFIHLFTSKNFYVIYYLYLALLIKYKYKERLRIKL